MLSSEVNIDESFDKRNFEPYIDRRLNQFLKNNFCFSLPTMFAKYPATSINNYFYKRARHQDKGMELLIQNRSITKG